MAGCEQLADEVHRQCSAMAASDRPRHVTMLEERVSCMERYVLADLLRLLLARHLHTPLHIDKLLPLVTHAGQVLARCTTSAKADQKIEVSTEFELERRLVKSKSPVIDSLNLNCSSE